VETFIVRVWTPSPELAHEVTSPELHGDVEHVRSRTRLHFHSTNELVELLRAVARPTERGSAERLKRT
jgi:hypothetical protein